MRVCLSNPPAIVFALVALVMSDAAAQVGGVDVNLDPGPAVHNEISLALLPSATPGSPQVLLAAYNDTPFPGGNGLGISRSVDGGLTWSPQQLPFPVSGITGATLLDAFDPSASADTSGNLFASHISTDGMSAGVSGLYVWRSADGGVTWQGPAEVSADPASALPAPPDPAYRFNDRDQLAVDRFAGSARLDDVYVAWIKDRGWYTQAVPPPGGVPPPSDIYFSSSTDGGVSFSTPVMVNDVGNNLANMPVARVAADASIYLTWLDYDVWNAGKGTIFVDRSTDGGATWGTDRLVYTILNLPPVNVTTQSGAMDARAKGAPVPATSPTNASELYVAFAQDPDGAGADEADVFFIRSTDGAATWSSPLRLHNDATTNDQVMPWMDVAPDGTIVVGWYDRQYDFQPFPLGDRLWSFVYTTSTDGGLTFAPEVAVNDVAFTTPAGGVWMGEYPGLVTESGYAYLSWATSVLEPNGDVLFDRATTLPPSPCGATPRTGCRQAGAGRSKVTLVDSTDGTRDKLQWKWSRGAATNLSDFSDPVSGSARYHVCVHDSSASVQPIADLGVAAGGTCGTTPCWRATGTTGFLFRDRARAQDGAAVLKLKAGTAGKPLVLLKAAGAALPQPGLPLATPVTVELLVDDGATVQCWQTVYSSPPLANDATTFRAVQ